MSEADKIIESLKNSGKKVEEFYVSNKTSDDVANIERLNNFANMTFLYGNRVNLNVSGLKGLQKDIKHLLAELEQKDERIQELEEQVKMLDEAYTGTIKESKKWFDIAHNSIPTQVVEELKNSITLDSTIVGGRRNGKTLEYGIKLGKIKACEKLLEELSFNLRHNRAKIYEQGEK